MEDSFWWNWVKMYSQVDCGALNSKWILEKLFQSKPLTLMNINCQFEFEFVSKILKASSASRIWPMRDKGTDWRQKIIESNWLHLKWQNLDLPFTMLKHFVIKMFIVVLVGWRTGWFHLSQFSRYKTSATSSSTKLYLMTNWTWTFEHWTKEKKKYAIGKPIVVVMVVVLLLLLLLRSSIELIEF